MLLQVYGVLPRIVQAAACRSKGHAAAAALEGDKRGQGALDALLLLACWPCPAPGAVLVSSVPRSLADRRLRDSMVRTVTDM
jgi:hypothetical protein